MDQFGWICTIDHLQEPAGSELFFTLYRLIMKKIILWLILVLAHNQVLAQTILQGQVMDKHSLAIEGATVSILGEPTVGKSEKDGQFTINSPIESGKLMVSKQGFKNSFISFKGRMEDVTYFLIDF